MIDYTDYTILTMRDQISLGEAVFGMMQKGWRPIGGVAVNSYLRNGNPPPSYWHEYSQAMVRLPPPIPSRNPPQQQDKRPQQGEDNES